MRSKGIRRQDNKHTKKYAYPDAVSIFLLRDAIKKHGSGILSLLRGQYATDGRSGVLAPSICATSIAGAWFDTPAWQ